MEHTGSKMKESDILKDVFGGLKQTKEYVISEIEHWGSPNLNAGRMWDNAVKAGRIKQSGSIIPEWPLYVLDGGHK